MLINPTLACSNRLDMKGDIDSMLKAGINIFHIDIMDGHYVPNLCLDLEAALAVKKYTKATVDVHLMVTNPFTYIEQLQNIGVDMVAFHPDTTSFSVRLISSIQQKGMKAGFVINPSQRIEEFEYLLPIAEYVMVMAVEPGFSGQCFIETAYTKIEKLNKLRNEKGFQYFIQVDGGIDAVNGNKCIELGADMLVAGAFAIFNQPDGLYNACVRFQKFIKR